MKLTGLWTRLAPVIAAVTFAVVVLLVGLLAVEGIQIRHLLQDHTSELRSLTRVSHGEAQYNTQLSEYAYQLSLLIVVEDNQLRTICQQTPGCTVYPPLTPPKPPVKPKGPT